MDKEPFETMESMKFGEIDEYLNAVLKNYKGAYNGSGVNFMESPKSNKSNKTTNWL